jgi:hypothetical protein
MMTITIMVVIQIRGNIITIKNQNPQVGEDGVEVNTTAKK